MRLSHGGHDPGSRTIFRKTYLKFIVSSGAVAGRLSALCHRRQSTELLPSHRPMHSLFSCTPVQCQASAFNLGGATQIRHTVTVLPIGYHKSGSHG